MADFQETARQVGQAISLLNGLDMADKESVRQETLQCVSKIQAFLDRWQSVSPGDSESVEQTREQIADCRASLSDCLPKLEEVQTEWAHRYRSECGGKTGEYEKLSDTLQQQVPEVYRWKRNYEQSSQALEALYRLNGQLMDVGSQLEQERLDRMPPVEIGPAGRYDRDPAPSANRS